MKANQFKAALCAALDASSIVLAFVFVVLLLAAYWPGPYLDYWADTKNIQNLFDGIINPGELLTAHNNAHRILIPRLALYLDNLLFAGSNLLILLIGVTAKIICFVIFNKSISVEGKAERAILNFFLAFLLFNGVNLFNIVFSSDIQWDLMILFSILSIYFYLKVIIPADRLQNPKENNYSEKNKIYLAIAAYVFLLAGVFSQGGSTGTILVFILAALVYRKYYHLAVAIGFCIAYIKLNSSLPFSHSGGNEMSKAIGTLLFNPLAIILYMINFPTGAAAHEFPVPHIYLACYLLLLFLYCCYAHIKSALCAKSSCGFSSQYFFYLSVLFLIMLFSIAASRSQWRPDSWVVNRYQTIPVMFIASISFCTYFGITKGSRLVTAIKSIILTHLFYFLAINYLHYYKDSFEASNKVFNAHSSMLFYGVKQKNAIALWPFVKKGEDPIAEPDPFFRKNNLAYYTNKQIEVNGKYKFHNKRSSLVSADLMNAYSASCEKISGDPAYSTSKKGGLLMEAPMSGSFLDNPGIYINRNTYYAVNDSGKVTGFAFLKLNADFPFGEMKLNARVVDKSTKYIVEIRNNEPACLFMLG